MLYRLNALANDNSCSVSRISLTYRGRINTFLFFFVKNSQFAEVRDSDNCQIQMDLHNCQIDLVIFFTHHGPPPESTIDICCVS